MQNEFTLDDPGSAVTFVEIMPWHVSACECASPSSAFQVRKRKRHSVNKRGELTEQSSSTLTPFIAPPKEFDYHITVYDGEDPIDQKAAYVNLLEAMDDVAFMPQQAPMNSWRAWALPGYPSQVEIKADQARFAVWGISYLNAELYRGRKRPMSIDMAWEGNFAGEIHISNEHPGENKPTISNSSTPEFKMNNATSSLDAEQPGMQFIATPNGGVTKVQYIVSTNGDHISMRNVFYTAVSILASSAAEGLDRPFASANDNLGFSFKAAFDGQGHSMMTEADLARTVTYVARELVRMDDFREAKIQVLKNDVLAGQGMFTNARKKANA